MIKVRSDLHTPLTASYVVSLKSRERTVFVCWEFSYMHILLDALIRVGFFVFFFFVFLGGGLPLPLCEAICITLNRKLS